MRGSRSVPAPTKKVSGPRADPGDALMLLTEARAKKGSHRGRGGVQCRRQSPSARSPRASCSGSGVSSSSPPPCPPHHLARRLGLGQQVRLEHTGRERRQVFQALLPRGVQLGPGEPGPLHVVAVLHRERGPLVAGPGVVHPNSPAPAPNRSVRTCPPGQAGSELRGKWAGQRGPVMELGGWRLRTAVTTLPAGPGRVGMGKCEGKRLNLRGFRPVTPDWALRRARDGAGRVLRVDAAVAAPSAGPDATDWVLMEKG